MATTGLDGRTFTELRPHGPIARFVNDLCAVDFDEGVAPRSFLLPEGTAAVTIKAPRGGSPRLEVKGPQTKAVEISLEGLRWALGVQFRPGSGRPFLGVPLDELTDRTIGLEELWHEESEGLCERIFAQATSEARLRVIERALERRLPAVGEFEHSSRLVSAALRRLEQEQTWPIRQLADQLGISDRQLRRHFQAMVGMAPKEYAGLMRFQRAVHAMATGRHANQAELAAEAGYYDQAHMIADFRKRTGRTPGALLSVVA